MTTHFIHPEDEFRECPGCQGSGYAVNCTQADRERGDLWACLECNGTGKIRTDAKPEIEIKAYEDLSNSGTLYFWRKKVPDQRYWAKGWSRPFPTVALALADARKELTQENP